jgi:hypothetical protein
MNVYEKPNYLISPFFQNRCGGWDSDPGTPAGDTWLSPFTHPRSSGVHIRVLSADLRLVGICCISLIVLFELPTICTHPGTWYESRVHPFVKSEKWDEKLLFHSSIQYVELLYEG